MRILAKESFQREEKDFIRLRKGRVCLGTYIGRFVFLFKKDSRISRMCLGL